MCFVHEVCGVWHVPHAARLERRRDGLQLDGGTCEHEALLLGAAAAPNGAAEQQNNGTAPAPAFEAGARVKIHGLVSRAALNDCFGIIESYNASSGRYAVALEQGGEAPIALKPLNLTLAPAVETEVTASRI